MTMNRGFKNFRMYCGVFTIFFFRNKDIFIHIEKKPKYTLIWVSSGIFHDVSQCNYILNYVYSVECCLIAKIVAHRNSVPGPVFE